MAAEHSPEETVEVSDRPTPETADPGPAQPEEAPNGASSGGETTLSEEERLEAERRSGQDRRAGQDQRAGAAAYAAAQSAAPQRPAPAGAEDVPDAAEAAAGREAAGAAATAEAAGPDAAPEDDEGRQVQQDLQELTSRAQKADEYLALAQRTQADFENYRKRAAREAGLAQERGVAKLAKELLPAIDNLDRALKAMGDEHSQYAEGIRLVHTDLLSALQRVGVEPFSPEGELFDPQVHEAVAQQPIDGVDSGHVAEVFQQGFRLGDSVLRPARVLVAA